MIWNGPTKCVRWFNWKISVNLVGPYADVFPEITAQAIAQAITQLPATALTKKKLSLLRFITVYIGQKVYLRGLWLGHRSAFMTRHVQQLLRTIDRVLPGVAKDANILRAPLSADLVLPPLSPRL